MKTIFIQILLIGFLYFCFSAANRTYNIFDWETVTIILWCLSEIFVIIIPPITEWINEPW